MLIALFWLHLLHSCTANLVCIMSLVRAMMHNFQIFGNAHVSVPLGNLNRQITDIQGQYKLILYHTTLIGDLLHGIHELPVLLLVCILREAWM